MIKEKLADRGLSLMEVLVAMAILLIGILAILKIFPAGLAGIEKTRYNRMAESFVDSHLEELSGWNFDDLPVSIPVETPNGARTNFTIPGVDIYFNEPGTLENRAPAGSSFEKIESVAGYTFDSDEGKGILSFTASQPPAAGSVVRASLRNKAWSERIRNDQGQGYVNGLPEGVEDIFIYYADDSLEPCYGAPDPDTGANISDTKIIEIRLGWEESGQERKLVRRVVVRR